MSELAEREREGERGRERARERERRTCPSPAGPQSVTYRHIALPARQVLPGKLGPLALPLCIEMPGFESRANQTNECLVKNTVACQLCRRFLETNWVDECGVPPHRQRCAGME